MVLTQEGTVPPMCQENHKYSDRKNKNILYHTKYSQAANKVKEQLDSHALQLCHTPGESSKTDYVLFAIDIYLLVMGTEC